MIRLVSYFHLVYHSKASPTVDQAQLQSILVVSRDRNARDQITGFLIYRDGFFLQLLEGEESLVRACLDRIRLDNRNSAVTVLAEVNSEERIMPKWSMALLDSDSRNHSAEDLIDLFNLGRGPRFYVTKEPVEFLLRKFAASARVME